MVIEVRAVKIQQQRSQLVKIQQISTSKNKSPITLNNQDQIIESNKDNPFAKNSIYLQLQLIKIKQSMMYSPLALRMSSPVKSKQNIFKDSQSINEDYLYDKMNLILLTFQAEKQEFEQKVASQKRELQNRVFEQSQIIKSLEEKLQQTQQQCKLLRFNYHQRGCVVDYLKKKVTVIENKFDCQKEEMLSVVKYLQSRNCQLNQLIYELKSKQAQLNQNLITLQEKYFNLTNQYTNKNMTQRISLNPQTKRTSLSNRNNGSFTPIGLSTKHKFQSNTSLSRQNILSNLFIDDTNTDSLRESSVKDKTIKFQNILNRARSQDQIDFAQLNHIISLGGHKNKHTEIQQLPGKGITINNYGQLTFSDFPAQQRPKKLTKQKKSYLSKPKLSLPNHGRYATQLNTQRTNKQILTSHQL